MCLIINKKACPNGYKIAKKNIPCYKIVIKGLFKYTTPYKATFVDIEKGLEADYFQEKPYNLGKYFRIDHGIHSYINLKIAEEEKSRIFREWYPKIDFSDIKVLKAFIPKGEKYWVGYYHQFCSERIVFAKK